MLTKKIKNNPMSRREFLGIAWGISLLGIFGQAGNALIRFLAPRVNAGVFGTKVIAGRLDEFQPGTISHIQKGRFYISRLEDGGIMALWQRCTHLGCTVPWKEDNREFLCPCHSSVFTNTGEVVSGPAPRPLDIFPLEIVDGEVIVDTGKPITRQSFDPSQVIKT